MERHADGAAPGRFGLFPQTRRGRCAAALLGVGMAFFAVTTLLATLGGLGGTGWLALTIIPAFVVSFIGTIIAAVAVVRDRERGGLVLVPLLAGLYLGALLIGELVAPH
jgi:hypothetical protein